MAGKYDWKTCVWCGQPSQLDGRDFLCFDCYQGVMDRLDDRMKAAGNET